MDTSKLKTVLEYAKMKGTSTGTVRNAISSGKIEATKIGNAIYVDSELYKDFDFSKPIGRPPSGLKKEMNEVLERVDKLEGLVQVLIGNKKVSVK